MLRIITLLLLIVYSLNYAGWEKLKSNSREWFTDVFFIDDYTGYVVGTNGTILKTTNAGENWENVSINNKEWLTSVHFTSHNKGFAVGTHALVASTEDGGFTWKSSYLPYMVNFHEICFTDKNTGWIVGGTVEGNGIILKTTDGGENWNPIIENYEAELLGVDFKLFTSGAVVGRNGQYLKTMEVGVKRVPNNYYDLVFEDVTFIGNDAWLCGDHCTLLKSTNEGNSWYRYPEFSDNHIFRTDFYDKDFGFAVGGNGNDDATNNCLIMETHDGGKNWHYLQLSSWSKLYSVFFSSRKRAYAVGYGGTILRYTSDVETYKVNPPPSFEVQKYSGKNYPGVTLNINLLYGSNVKILVSDQNGREVERFPTEYINAGYYKMDYTFKRIKEPRQFSRAVYNITLITDEYLQRREIKLDTYPTTN